MFEVWNLKKSFEILLDHRNKTQPTGNYIKGTLFRQVDGGC